MQQQMRQCTAADLGLAPPPKPWWNDLPVFCLLDHEFKALPEYSGTLPTGTTIGKRWRRHDGIFDRSCKNPVWVIGEYIDIGSPNKVGIRWYRAIVSREAIAADLGL